MDPLTIDRSSQIAYLGDDPAISELLEKISFVSYQSLHDANLSSLDGSPDLILWDVSEESTKFSDRFESVREQIPGTPLILLDQQENQSIAELSIKQGIQDYLLKPELDKGLLSRSIRYALDRWELEQELRAQSNQLEQSNEELQNFAYVISHDLQEPLRMITGYLELLEERFDDELDEKAKQYVREAVSGSERMKSMISDLLTYSRVKTQGEPLKPVDTNELLDGLLSDYQRVIEETGATIEYQTLPTVIGDRGQIRHLFQNLIENAIKFRGEQKPEITISADRTIDKVEFHVQDNGIGIDPDNHDQIFMIFRRVHRDEYEGTGLGLALCKRIVERHGGTIRVESEPGSGSTFHFTLEATE